MPPYHPRILHIDDNPAMLRLSRLLLGAAGFEVLTTDDPEDVLAAVSQDYDLFIVDLLLPDIDGISLCRRLRDAGWDGPILVLSNKTLSGHERKRLRALGAMHKVKAFGPQELIQSVQRCLTENRWAGKA